VPEFSYYPTCLPGPGGIGSLGAERAGFSDWMAESGPDAWQVCPLGPTGFGDFA
jgi:4-alpha-glucanotransferase